MRLKIFHRILLFWTFFIGIGALYGGICMLIKPDGSLVYLDKLLPYFQVLPFAEVLFQNYIFSGIMLILINGISNLSASILILKKKKVGYILGTIFGITLMLWISIQFIIFPFYWIDLFFFIFGFFQFLTGYIAFVSYQQEHFSFDESNYPNVQEKSKILVVYFSRKQYTKKIAYQKANDLYAQIKEIKSLEKTSGDLGFWWCGRFAMHQWPMPIENIQLDLHAFKKIVIVTPIWVFKMAAPIRSFIAENKAILKEKKVDIIFNHFNPWLPKGAIKEINKMIPIEKIESKTTWFGHTFKK